jgi:hypothetical protein
MKTICSFPTYRMLATVLQALNNPHSSLVYEKSIKGYLSRIRDNLYYLFQSVSVTFSILSFVDCMCVDITR